MELISREEAMEAILAIKEVMLTNGEVINALYHVPTIESRAKGKWIKGDMFECDQCHHRMIVGDGAYNYCPNCGAEMECEE